MLRMFSALSALVLALFAGPALAAGAPKEPRHVAWGFDGPFGKHDPVQLQRGYKVYREVCASCHSMSLMSYRNLGQKGGPFYDAKYPNPNDSPYVKALAAEAQVNDIDSETGDVIQRPATSADRFASPFPNEAAARASNGGSNPPDLSVMTKARHNGPSYVYSLLTGYVDPPAGLTVGPGQYYNPYMPGDLTSAWTGQGHAPKGGFIAMPPPLTEDRVTYDDGTAASVDQMSKDVSAFMAWSAEPKMQERKAFGLGAMIYLLIFSIILWFSYRRVWRHVAH